jgi:integral membrane protein (TIGR01906 family)
VRRIATALIGLALAVLVIGLTLIPLTTPVVTRVLAQRYALAEEAGLPPQRMLEVAEQVRAFVADPAESTLPEQVDGRPGFDVSAVSHLADVRRVITAAQYATWVLAILLGIWLGVALARGHQRHVGHALLAGAVWCAALIFLAALAGTLNFDALFTAFHGLFFAAGTWMFASDSLLIQTFPEQFWATAAALWAGLILLGAVGLAAGSHLLLAPSKAPLPTVHEGPSADRA